MTQYLEARAELQIGEGLPSAGAVFG